MKDRVERRVNVRPTQSESMGCACGEGCGCASQNVVGPVEPRAIAGAYATWAERLMLAEGSSYAVIVLSLADKDIDEVEAISVLEAAVNRALRGRRINAELRTDRSELAVILPVPNVRRGNTIAGTVVDEVRNLIRLSRPSASITVGLSGVAGGSLVPRRLDEALISHAVGRSLNGVGATTRFRDLRAYPAMIEAIGQGDGAFADLHDRYLGCLVSYEGRTGLPLIHTLAALFDANGNVSSAARSLGINRQSLLYRLRKIETMSEIELANPGDRFALELAVRSWMVQTALAVDDSATESPMSASGTWESPRDRAATKSIAMTAQSLAS